jgi:glutamyl-tRNA reductase
MLERLHLYNFNPNENLATYDSPDAFHLKTCQRNLILSTNEINDLSPGLKLKSTEAYNYLLEVICGLQSQLIGENEIVGQFKQAYKQYVDSSEKDTSLLVILEKLFQDAKHIRSKYLLGLSQKTYASIARKKIVSNYQVDSVLILGSGQLAEDLINQFKKKTKVFISARNHDKVQRLADLHQVEIIDWNQKEQWLDFPFILNSIGFEGTLLDDHFFKAWTDNYQEKLFIDLGSPTAIKTSLDLNSGVMRLSEVFKEGAIKEKEKREKIQEARMAIEEIVNKRHRILKEKNLKRQKQNLKLNYAY